MSHTANTTTPRRRSCDELALGQRRSTPCAGCQHPFAPGAIERHTPAPPHRRAGHKPTIAIAAIAITALYIAHLAGAFLP